MHRLGCSLVVFLLLFAPRVFAQTVVEMDLSSAVKILKTHKLAEGVYFVTQLANNYRHYTNVRVQSKWHKESLAALAKALRTDFDGTGKGYIPDLTIWRVEGDSGAKSYLAASLLDRRAVLLAVDLDYLKGMIAYEILAGVRRGLFSVQEAQRRAIDVGIEMQVTEDRKGERTITFFGHREDSDKLIGKLMVIEPPDMVWD
jgi:hypothetical protein